MDSNYYMPILIPFDLLIDTDIGVVKVATYKYNDYDYFDFSRLSGLNEQDYKSLFEYRLCRNPLYMITDIDLPEEERENVDNLYKKILEENYKDVLNYSELTAIHRIIAAGTYSEGGPFRITVICKNDLEVDCVKCLSFKSDIIMCKTKLDICDINMKNYKYIFIKDVEDLEYYGDLIEKVLFIANYRFNKIYINQEYIESGLESNYMIDPKFILNLVSDNIIKTIDVYPQPDDVDIDYQ